MNKSLDTKLADHAVAVVREAVSNVVHHAQGDTVTVTLSVGDELQIVVSDNGIGMPEDTTASGLSNLGARAVECGGSMNIGPGSSGRGTDVTWSVPLP